MEESSKHVGTRLVGSCGDQHNFIPCFADAPFGPTATHALALDEPFELTLCSCCEAPSDPVSRRRKFETGGPDERGPSCQSVLSIASFEKTRDRDLRHVSQRRAAAHPQIAGQSTAARSTP